MPSWNELLTEFSLKPDDASKVDWLQRTQQQALQGIAEARGDRNVIFYASGFLQKPIVQPFALQITHEDINAFMTVMYGMDFSKGLTLLLHTPGGVTNAAETIVAYLRSKFPYIEVIIPTFAMSAGTMISLAADKIVMGRQSQLGPIDTQMPVVNRFVSARAIVDQFEKAEQDIKNDVLSAHVWAPILQSVGPALLIEAQNALDYGERMVTSWLSDYMFSESSDPIGIATRIASHFNDASIHKSHGRRIDRKEAREQGLIVEDLEDNQTLQEHVLTLYHLITITFENSPATKIFVNNSGNVYIKNWTQ